MLIMMHAAADNVVIMKTVAATTAAVVISAVSADVVVVIPEAIVVGKHPAMDSSATMSNHRGFRGLKSCRWDRKGVLLKVLVANCRKFFMRVTKLKPTLGSPLVSSMSLTRTF